MKSLLLLLALSPAFAEEAPLPKDFSFRCVSTMPTTSFLGEVKGENLELTVIHHNGTGYMPIHRGIVVPNDFPYLKEKAEALTKMGERQLFKFPLEKCKLYAPTRFSCASGDKQEFGGVPMEALYFHTTKITEESFDWKFERTKAELNMLISGLPVQEVPMEYYDGECKFSTSK
jgi:hypothetical protein